MCEIALLHKVIDFLELIFDQTERAKCRMKMSRCMIQITCLGKDLSYIFYLLKQRRPAINWILKRQICAPSNHIPRNVLDFS